ncbi:hypothetical protein N752_30215 [Desulforamulus aquiferis]|nr:hypothetical protein N752_30215 [Desulforamulus aquiferis]
MAFRFSYLEFSLSNIYYSNIRDISFRRSINFISPLAEAIKNKRILKWEPIALLIGLLIIHGMSLLWSDDIRLGFRTIIYLLPFIIVFCASYNLALENLYKLREILSIFVISALTVASIVIIFRVAPSLEEMFLHSTIAKLFINPNTLENLYTTERNNILDPVKSGAFFVNANIAACYLGICSFISWGIGEAYQLKWYKVASVLLWISVWFTGSKAGIILIYTLSIAGYLLYKYHNKKLNLYQLLKSLAIYNTISLCVAIVVFWFIPFMHSVNNVDNKYVVEDKKRLVQYQE